MSDLVPLTGEPLALDLVNTRPLLPEGPVDLLATPAGLAGWLSTQAGRLDGAGVLDAGVDASRAWEGLTDDDVAAVHAVRDHVAVALTHVRRGERPPAAALDGLNGAQRAAPAIRELTWESQTGDGAGAIAVTLRRSGPLGVRLAAWLAEAAADLLADPKVGRVRACEADDCVMLFLPAHPRRRWCSAARCGNRARVARYYQRHKAT
ncbi:CGNR zinc finger domain-containing protein [Nonomuraea rhodomycinica]|uniref:CGNR zinc finger domain-containing protein n=1 Tax=Nonomuraea rhodomycinica TaxID=1712872 RepID=A0A7Y6II04_9ACTN|nr:CGNR zinc finger domain-containing protein [Nonomuraea rhodomycinica]NUW38593.1 CGNR zinc finger domain-containing protein [Nonomuraea rhodomycinica]